MKKFGSFALVLCMCLAFLMGCSSTDSWSIEDFSFYDEDGREVEFLTTADSIQDRISLSDINEEKSGDYQTYRGVKIGDRATTALEKYPLDDFYYAVDYFWGDGTSSKDEAEEKDASFHEQYPTFAEALQHADELSSGLNLFASKQFYAEENNMKPYEVNSMGKVDDLDLSKDNYEVTIIIHDSKIKDITFELIKGDDKFATNDVSTLPLQLPHNSDIHFGDTRSTIEKLVGELIEDDPRLPHSGGFTQQDQVQIGNASFYVSYYFSKDSDQLVNIRYIGDNDPSVFTELKETYNSIYGEAVTTDLYDEGDDHPYWSVSDGSGQEINAEAFVNSDSGKIVSFCSLYDESED